MKIVIMLRTINDEDIIQEVIEHYLSQDLELVILDNGSTDRTFEICEKFLNKGVLKIHQYHSKYFDDIQTLKIVYDLALTFDPDWVGVVDSDEFYETGLKNTTLKDVVIQADKEGYNLIQSDTFEFFLTNDDDESKKSVKDRLRHYSYVGDFQYKFWKWIPGTFFGEYAGHYPNFPEGYRYKIYPKKMIVRHYPFRSTEHALRKMSMKMRNRSEDNEDSPHIDMHEKKILSQDFSSKVDSEILAKYEEDGFWDFQKRYKPFNQTTPITKEDIFTDDGKLKNIQKSFKENKLLIRSKNQQIKKLNERNKDLRERNKDLREDGVNSKRNPFKKFFRIS